MTAVDDAAAGIVLRSQEYAETVWFARLVSSFLKTLEAEGIEHIAAIALTQTWMGNEQSVDDGPSD